MENINNNQTMKVSKRLITNQNIISKPLKISFDITTLDKIICFIYKESVLRTRKTLSNIYKLFLNIDKCMYEDNVELSSRIWIIITSLKQKFESNIDDYEYLKSVCKDDESCTDYICKLIDNISNLKITHEESKYLIKKMDDSLAYGYTTTIKEIIKEIINNIEDDNYKSYKAVNEDLNAIATSIININRNTKSLGSDQTFSLQNEQFETVIEDAVQRLKDRNRMLFTGIQRLNTLLAPGYLSKRLYTYLAFPGKGKSTILLKSALDIRKYNKGIKTKDPDKRPAVVFLTLENDIPETIERIYNMSVDSDDLRNYRPNQVIKKMKDVGELTLTEENNIDIIIKEYKNRELDTNDLYGIINDLSDDGVETICLIVDYLKRIRPSEKAASEKEELKNITNELKELAKFFDIPVISAQQLNRTGASIIDAALQANKEDVTRLVGRDAIATAWEIIENSDWVCIVNPEVKKDTNELYFIFKMLKRRYRSADENEKMRRLDYFAHPFTPGNEIRLIDDKDLDKSVSLESLSTQFVAMDDKRGKTSSDTRNKEKKEKDKKKKSEYIDENEDEFSPFDFTQNKNF